MILLNTESVLRGHMNEIGSARARAVGFGSDQDEGSCAGYDWLDELLCVSLSGRLAIGIHACRL